MGKWSDATQGGDIKPVTFQSRIYEDELEDALRSDGHRKSEKPTMKKRRPRP